jgi:hypothetical protein
MFTVYTRCIVLDYTIPLPFAVPDLTCRGLSRYTDDHMDWSPSVAYCVGLITTDGCLSGDGRHIEFSSKDLELVKHMQHCLGQNNRIGSKSRGHGPSRYFRIQLGNVKLYRWLCSIGLSPRKSLTLGALDIPD